MRGSSFAMVLTSASQAQFLYRQEMCTTISCHLLLGALVSMYHFVFFSLI